MFIQNLFLMIFSPKAMIRLGKTGHGASYSYKDFNLFLEKNK